MNGGIEAQTDRQNICLNLVIIYFKHQKRDIFKIFFGNFGWNYVIFIFHLLSNISIIIRITIELDFRCYKHNCNLNKPKRWRYYGLIHSRFSKIKYIRRNSNQFSSWKSSWTETKTMYRQKRNQSWREIWTIHH